MKKVFHYLDKNLEELLLIILLAVIACLILLNIVMRYIFKSALSWPEELCRYCYVYSGMLTAGYCIKKNAGFRVDILYNFFPRPLRIVIEYISRILVTLLWGFMAYSSIGLIAATSTVSSALKIPMQFVYLSIPIGMTLGVIRGIQDLVFYTKRTFKKEESAC